MSKFVSQININDEYTLPTSAGSTGQVLALNGSDAEWTTISSGSGTVSGTGTNHTVAMFDGTSDIEDSQIYQGNTGYVGMQKAIPTAPLHVWNNEDGKSTQLTLENGDTSLSTGQVMAGIVFQSNDASTNASGSAGKISSIAENTTGAFAMTFDTKNGSSLGERMRIDPDGKIGIGTDNPTAQLHVDAGATNQVAKFVSTDGDAYFSVADSNDEAFFGTSSNSFYVGNSATDYDTFNVSLTDGSVGFGTQYPSEPLHLRNGTSDTSLKINAFNNTAGTESTIKFASVASSGSYEKAEIAFVSDTGGSGRGDLHFRVNNTAGTTNVGSGDEVMTIVREGRVGILDTTPSYPLDVTGTIRATGNVIAYSDARVKENVKTIENASNKVSKLRGVSYNKIGESEVNIGVIAQEIEKVVPEVVKTDENGMKAVAYANLVGLLIESNKELQKRIEILESK